MAYTITDYMDVQRWYDPPNIPGREIDPIYQPPANSPFNVTATTLSTVNTNAAVLNELALLHANKIAALNLISTGTGSDAAKQDPTYTVKRPWLDAPDGAVPFDEANAAALGVVGVTTVVVSHTFPDGYDGVINAFSANFTGGGFVQGSGDLIFQLQRDGVPIRNYNNILVEKGTIGIPRVIAPLRGYSKQTISLVVIHAANGLLAGNVVGSLVGYDYPSES